MQRDCEEHILGSVEQEARVELLAGILRKETPEVKKEEARGEKIERATHNEGGPIQGIEICKLKEVQGRSLANAKHTGNSLNKKCSRPIAAPCCRHPLVVVAFCRPSHTTPPSRH
jgi:hypothetical protein